MLHAFSGPSCGPLVYVSYGLAHDIIGTLVNDTVTITCIPGYHLDDGVIEQQVTCLDTLQYSGTRNCLGTIIMYIAAFASLLIFYCLIS
jgi:hypothetical protein